MLQRSTEELNLSTAPKASRYSCFSVGSAVSCPKRDPRAEIKVRHPTDCNKFCDCTSGVGKERQCAKGQTFHPLGEKCVSSEIYPCEGGWKMSGEERLYGWSEKGE